MAIIMKISLIFINVLAFFSFRAAAQTNTNTGVVIETD